VDKTPLEQAEVILREVDEILLLPATESATKRIGKFRELAQTLRTTVAYEQGMRTEFQQLIALVSPLLEAITQDSPHVSRAIREIPGLREARRNLVDYIERVRP